MYFFLQNDYIKNRLKNFIFSVSQYSYLKKKFPAKQKHEYHGQKGNSSKTPNPFQKTEICIYMCIKKNRYHFQETLGLFKISPKIFQISGKMVLIKKEKKK